GAGNLLGGEQSGHIAGVGFDLYVRLVGEAIADFKGESPADQIIDVKVDLPVDANLPHDYVTGERLRLELYRKLAAVGSPDDLAAVTDEIVDRYGPMPQPVQNLVAVAAFRLHARRHGVREVSMQGGSVRFAPVELPDSKVMRLQRLYPRSLYKHTVRTVSAPRPQLRDIALLDWARGLLDGVLGEPAIATKS
ncbi:MAG: TRCF domain-containing protein, partial [Mycobacteriales bacterium]